MHKFNIKSLEKLDNQERRKMMPPKETLMKFNIQDDGALLDVGCGIGYFTIPAAEILNNNRVIGIDIRQEMLEAAEKRKGKLSNIEFLKSEEYVFPVDNNSMKYVFISNVIHEVEDKTKYFKEIMRVLDSEGYVLIIDWKKKDMKEGPPVQDRISREEMVEIGSNLGLTPVAFIDITENHYGVKLIRDVDKGI